MPAHYLRQLRLAPQRPLSHLRGRDREGARMHNLSAYKAPRAAPSSTGAAIHHQRFSRALTELLSLILSLG
jgi:hypothetical protein